MVGQSKGGQSDSFSDEGPVLVAVDFSKDSEAALLWACRYAIQIGAEIIVLHVVHDSAEIPGSYRRSEADALRPMQDIAAEMLNEFVESFRKSHPETQSLGPLKAKLVEGIPETRIIEAAKELNCPMIVMGSRGLSGLPHLLIGSIAEHVVQRSPITVTIVKHKDQESEDD